MGIKIRNMTKADERKETKTRARVGIIGIIVLDALLILF